MLFDLRTAISLEVELILYVFFLHSYYSIEANGIYRYFIIVE